MPRRRKIHKPRLAKVKSLADISKGEITLWMVYGPDTSKTPWPAWVEVYSIIRQELLDKYRRKLNRLQQEPRLAGYVKKVELPACERLFQAIQRGENPDALQEQISLEVAAGDPRKVVFT